MHATNNTDAANTAADKTLQALRLQEEQVCGRYLEARQAMVKAAARAASVKRLADEHPNRVDYRDAYYTALDAYNAAAARTELAFNAWHRAQLRSDTRWTATEGRRLAALVTPGTSVKPTGMAG